MDNNRLKLFEKFNKELINAGDLDAKKDALSALWLLTQEEMGVTSNSKVLRQFVESFFSYERSVELELEYALNLSNIRTANLITYLKNKKQLRKLGRAFCYLNLFHVKFYNVYGVSLTRTKEAMDKEQNSKVLAVS